MLKVEGIYKKYGKKQVLKNLSFMVPEGSIYTLVGAFGEGKTTLLNIIAGYDKADKGDIYIKGIEVQTNPDRARGLFGFVPDNFPMYDELSGKEYLEFFGHIMSDKDDEQIKHLAVNLLGFVGLGKYIDTRIKKYDYHMRQKLSIARALLHNPKFIILDEPFYGLDVKYVKEIKEIIDFLHDQGRTIFMTSDNLNLSASVSTAIGIMEDGTMLTGEKVRNAYASLASKTRMKNMTVRNEMIKERTINLSAQDEHATTFDFEDVTSEYMLNNEVTRNPDMQTQNVPLPDLSYTMHQMPNLKNVPPNQNLSHTMHQMLNLKNVPPNQNLSHTMHQMPNLKNVPPNQDLSHTMHQMPNLNNVSPNQDLSHTMHQMPNLNNVPPNQDLSHTMHQMPNLNNVPQKPDLSYTMHQMPNLNNVPQKPDLSHTMHQLPPMREPVQMPYEELEKIHNSRTGEDISNRIQNKSNRLNVEKRGAGGSRVVTNKNNVKKK